MSLLKNIQVFSSIGKGHRTHYLYRGQVQLKFDSIFQRWQGYTRGRISGPSDLILDIRSLWSDTGYPVFEIWYWISGLWDLIPDIRSLRSDTGYPVFEIWYRISGRQDTELKFRPVIKHPAEQLVKSDTKFYNQPDIKLKKAGYPDKIDIRSIPDRYFI